jgi:hypothetical protein
VSAVDATTGRDPVGTRLLLAGLIGAAVALALGIYGNVHDPSQAQGEQLDFTLFFASTISMKVWMASAAVLFALIQILSALWVYGKLGVEAPDWAGSVHRISGRLAFLVSLPVAYHCLWSIGFQDTDTRVLVHSLLGCFFYGAFATKVVIVRSPQLPGIALPIAGGVVFTTLVVLWYTSALWYVDQMNGFPPL